MAAFVAVARGVLMRHPITAHGVLGHSDVAPARKTDPGELFPWAQLADFGIGLWPKANGAHAVDTKGLRRFGYGLAPDVETPEETVITAFQRHFRPTKVDGVWDDESGRVLANLLAIS